MGVSIIDICNMALSNCRSSKFIEGLDERSVEAQTCKIWYEPTRDVVLGAADWPFARRRVGPIKEGTPPPEWKFSYAIPNDCIMVRAITADSFKTHTLDEKVKYTIENSGDGSSALLYCDLDTENPPDPSFPILLAYTMRIKDPAMFPADFVEALAWKLSANIARPLDKDQAICKEALQFSRIFIGEAVASAYNELRPDREAPSDLFTSRLA